MFSMPSPNGVCCKRFVGGIVQRFQLAVESSEDMTMVDKSDEEEVLERIRAAVAGLDISYAISALAVVMVEKSLHALRLDDGSDDPAELKKCLAGLTAGSFR